MQLTIVTALYNQLDLTQAFVEALPASLPRGLSWECILVDDGSTDGTRDWLRTLPPPFRTHLNTRNLGFGGANNAGAALARGRSLALLNNDLVLQPGWFEPMRSALRRPGTGIVGNLQYRVDTGELDHAGIEVQPNGKPEHLRTDRPGRFGERDCPRRWAVTGACLLLRARLFRRLGGFDTAFFNGSEDVDLCLRAAAQGYACRVARRSQVGHHVSASRGVSPKQEENSCRLAHRWRGTLVREAARRWAEDRPVAPTLSARLDAWLGTQPWWPKPPRRGLAGAEQAMVWEEMRWREIIPPEALAQIEAEPVLG